MGFPVGQAYVAPAPLSKGVVMWCQVRELVEPCSRHWFFQWFCSFSRSSPGARPGPGRGGRRGQGRAPGLARAPWLQRKGWSQINQFIWLQGFCGRQSAILQGWQPPAAAACPPPGSYRFFDFPLVFPYESAQAQGVLRRSPGVLAREPRELGRSSRFIAS